MWRANKGDELHVDVCAQLNGSCLLRAGGRLTWRARHRQPRAMILIGDVWHGKNTISHAFQRAGINSAAR